MENRHDLLIPIQCITYISMLNIYAMRLVKGYRNICETKLQENQQLEKIDIILKYESYRKYIL